MKKYNYLRIPNKSEQEREEEKKTQEDFQFAKVQALYDDLKKYDKNHELLKLVKFTKNTMKTTSEFDKIYKNSDGIHYIRFKDDLEKAVWDVLKAKELILELNPKLA